MIRVEGVILIILKNLCKRVKPQVSRTLVRPKKIPVFP